MNLRLTSDQRSQGSTDRNSAGPRVRRGGQDLEEIAAPTCNEEGDEDEYEEE